MVTALSHKWESKVRSRAVKSIAYHSQRGVTGVYQVIEHYSALLTKWRERAR